MNIYLLEYPIPAALLVRHKERHMAISWEPIVVYHRSAGIKTTEENSEKENLKKKIQKWSKTMKNGQNVQKWSKCQNCSKRPKMVKIIQIFQYGQKMVKNGKKCLKMV